MKAALFQKLQHAIPQLIMVPI